MYFFAGQIIIKLHSHFLKLISRLNEIKLIMVVQYPREVHCHRCNQRRKNNNGKTLRTEPTRGGVHINIKIVLIISPRKALILL